MIVVLSLVLAGSAAVRGLWSPCGLSMLSTLNPVAERARGHRPMLTALWYLLGAVAGGAVLGGVCALLALAGSTVTSAAAMAVVAVAGLVTAGSDARVLGRTLPDLPRQVNEQWIGTYRRWVYASGFGLQIGAGFATYVMTAANYLLVLAAAFSPPVWAFAVGLTFGTVRGATVFVGLLGSTPERLRGLMARVDALEPFSRAVLVAVQLAVAVVAASLAGGVEGGAGVGALVLVVTGVRLGVTRIAARHRAVPA